MRHLIFIAVIALSVWFSACQKEEKIPFGQPSHISYVTDTASSVIGATMLNDSTPGKETDAGPMKSWILGVGSANDIPTKWYSTAWSYKSQYIHVKQYSGECSWTSYVLCAGAIANGNYGYSLYPVSHPKITSVKNWCGSSYIERLRDYATQKDYSYFGSVYLSKEYKNSTGRFNTVKRMLDHLYVYNKPFLAIITRNGIGHYVVVWEINWKKGGTGSTVYYTDPLDYPAGTYSAQRQSMNMTDFLDKMGPLNSYVSKYCALFLR